MSDRRFVQFGYRGEQGPAGPAPAGSGIVAVTNGASYTVGISGHNGESLTVENDLLTWQDVSAGAKINRQTGSNAGVFTVVSEIPQGVSVVYIYARAVTSGNLACWSQERKAVVRRAGAVVTLVTDGTKDPDPDFEASTELFSATVSVNLNSLQITTVGNAKWEISSQRFSTYNEAPIPAPILTSVNPNSGPSSGSVIVSGVGFSTATTMQIAGVTASFVVNSDTQITATIPSGLSDGAKSVVVYNLGGASNSLTYTVTAFDLAQIAWTMHLLGSAKTSSQITGQASTGTSATHNLTSVFANSISSGASVSGRTTISWDSDKIWSAGAGAYDSDAIISADEFTVIGAIKVNSFINASYSYHDAPRLIGQGGGGAYFGIGGFEDGGQKKLIAGLYDGAFKSVEEVITQGDWIVFAIVKSTSGLKMKQWGGPWGPEVGCGGISNLSFYLNNYNAADEILDCDVERLLIINSALTETNINATMNQIAGQIGV